MHEIFANKQVLENGDIIDIKIFSIEKESHYAEGVRYSLAYIRNGKKVVGYDNYKKHGHHKHIRGKRHLYEFIDEWQLIDDFMKDVEKAKNGKGD